MLKSFGLWVILPLFSLAASEALPQNLREAGEASEARSDLVSKGTVAIFVLNVGNGDTLPGVTLQFKPSGRTAKTDLDGFCSVDLAAGKYAINATREGFLEYKVEDVEVMAGQTNQLDIALNPENLQLQETVEVVANQADAASNVALLIERKSAATMADAIGRQEMSRTPASDAADVMSRVTGVSIVDNKFVYVRGLGERYSSTQLNGSVLPSTQPEKKVVALDLFPASLLESIETEKSYTPDQPGEFAGGVVKINTIDFPREKTFRISYGNGFNTQTTFKAFQKYPGGKYEFFGYDDGTRDLPSAFPPERIVRATRFSPGLTPQELQALGRAFSNVWEFNTNDDANPAQKFNFMGGNTIGRLGFVLALSHQTGFQTQDERRTFYGVSSGDELQVKDDYDFQIGTQSARTSATANFAFRLTDNNKFLFRNFYTHNADDEARTFFGINRDISTEIRNFRLRLTEESIYSVQLGGEHYFNFFGGTLLEWNVTRSRSTLEDPDLRETLYEFDGASGRFVLADESQSGFRQFIGLAETVWEPSLSLSKFFYKGGFSGSLKFGVLYRDRGRDFGARRFRFVPTNTQGIDLSAPPEQIFAAENIRPDGFELREDTRNTDSYEAKQINRAFYGMADVSFGRWRFVGGARLENDTQRVDSFDPFSPELISVSSRLNNRDLLPSINAIYKLTPQMNLRGSFSKTLNRPEFRELAPFDFTDVVGGRSVIGFADLQQASILNYDARWEWFPDPSGLVSASFFYKDFDKPIERVVESTAQLRTSFRNAESARNFGFELDFRHDLGFAASRLSDFSVNVNYTFVNSSVTIPPENLLSLTNLDRPLAGQSRHIFNGIFEYQHPAAGTVIRGLLNFQGSRLTDVGSRGIPDIIEDGFTSLDAIFIQPFAQKWSLKVSAENLLNEEVRYLQGGLPQRVFKTGRDFSVTLTYSFFKEE